MKEFKNLKFENNAKGQRAKVEALAEASKDGWMVVSETLEPGKFKGGTACCLFIIFAPCAFLAGSTDGFINVTLSRDSTEKSLPSSAV